MECGEQCVMILGTSEMPTWFADNWDFLVYIKAENRDYAILVASYPGRPLALSTLYPKKISERKAW